MKKVFQKCFGIVWLGLACCGALRGEVTPPAVVLEKATFWVDASQLTVGTELTSWPDARGGSYPVASSYTSVKPKVISVAAGPLAGKPAVDFHPIGTPCDMGFDMQYVRTVFLVVDIDRSPDAFWLACHTDSSSNSYYLHRGNNGAYQLSNANVNGCAYYNDGYQVLSPTSTIVPTGYQLVTWSKSAEGRIDGFTNDRNISGRIGGKRLCEAILFRDQLSLVQQARVEAYLRAKWFGEAAMAGDYVLRKAQTRHDASATASIHLGEEGDSAGKVVQWDDLTGHGRTLKPSGCGADKMIVYGEMTTIGGRPVYNMGTTGSCIDLAMASAMTSTRSVVMVTEIDLNVNAFWLGAPSTFHFHRGSNATFAYDHSNNLLLKADGWQNGAKVANMKTDKPNGLGGLSVYVFNLKSAGTWQCLSSDRGGTERSGGKRLAELATFSGELDVETREEVERYLMKKWAPTSEYLQAQLDAAWVHVSAAKADNFLCTAGAITGWKNEGVGGELYKEETHGYDGATIEILSGTRGYTNGVPAFLMGPVSSGIDLAFPRSTAIWNAFWVMDIQQHPAAFFLGDSANYNFHRGNNGWYAYGVGTVQTALFSCDSLAVAAPKSTLVPTGLHVYDMEASSASAACYLSVDRVCAQTPGVYRNGGRALSELVVLTNHVTGLTRWAMSEYLANRWTRCCGWAGAGDEDWGPDSYRVFEADGTVPAGATAKGLGFTKDATLTGGPLAVGEGGVFISEGASVALDITVPADQPPLALYGPGTFVVKNAVDYRLDFARFKGARVIVEAGGTWTMPVATDVHALQVVVKEGGRLVLDLANATVPSQIVFGSLTLPEGADLLSCVTVVNAPEGGAGVQLMDDNTMWVLAKSTPRFSRWCGGGDVTNVSDVANWSSTDMAGDPVVAAPTAFTSVLVDGNTTFNVPRGQALVCRDLTFTNVSLAQDSDWRGLTQPLQGAIELAGHNLQISQCTGSAMVLNSSSTSVSELVLDIPEGASIENSTVGFSGALKVVKTGAGRYLSKRAQSYSGGTIIREGVFDTYNDGDTKQYAWAFSNCPQFGSTGSTVTIEPNGRLEVRGNYNLDAYSFVLAGGTLATTQNAMNGPRAGICGFTLTADSTIEFDKAAIFNSPSNEMCWVDLGGHTLTIRLAVNSVTCFCTNRGFSNGTVVVEWAKGIVGAQFVSHTTPNDFRSVDLVLDCRLNLEVESLVGNLSFEHNVSTDEALNNSHLNVYGLFVPLTDYWHNCVLQNGATLDLSSRAEPLSLVSPWTAKAISFEDGARITVKMGTRTISKGLQLLAWEEGAKPNAKFVLEGTSSYRLSSESDGLYCRSNGSAIILR